MTRGAKPITGSTFLILLALVDEDRHGLGIADEVEARTQGAVHLGPGTLYNAIHKMVEGGLIKPAVSRPAPAVDDPRRRYYRITRRGREVVQDEAARLDLILDAARAKAVLD
jgi:DNA-binding PadR family transcriptional regulator